ncbi:MULTISPECIES: enoyl-CoA hydratase/isomerase family protein [unclassified Dyella]|uniref:enoyl-CoA hydratase/isomerase family protein n=1 Tax=unclassified Dyella TaxID=2634549 RepID=UPI000C82F2A0|nr:MULTISPECIES: enoyl-CoA hydratase/isomerase family protein [unclassified Dyella]MDR3448045.1 enoyl-CoA hydratase/isomerase family protein [Dyella sp.]PMQ05498.1 1,4-dihydroxy-2-naphthoyl-CoA synthase [Dyella sp. AD56]
MSQSIQIADHGGVRRITLNRPQVHNAFDDGLIAELTAALEHAGEDGNVRAVVLTGEGASFSAGADLNWMRSMVGASEAENREDSLRLATLMRTLQYLPKPTIARVNGAAYGGGVGLVACCDIAIGVDTARFGLTEVKLGLVPAVISPYVIHAIGLRQARRLFVTGELFDAATALQIGLLHQCVPVEQLDDAVNTTLGLLAKAGPVAQAEAKQLALRMAGADENHAAQIDRENAALIARLRVSAEGQEGLGAFLGKRAASWCNQG